MTGCAAIEEESRALPAVASLCAASNRVETLDVADGDIRI